MYIAYIYIDIDIDTYISNNHELLVSLHQTVQGVVCKWLATVLINSPQ